MCCTNKVSLPWSLRQWQAQLKHLWQKFTNNAGRSGPDGVGEGLTNNAISASKLADFWLTYLVLNQLDSLLVFIVLLFALFRTTLGLRSDNL